MPGALSGAILRPETTRRGLYEAVVVIHFRPTASETQKIAEDPDSH
jgi:hypothetical protein